MRKLIGLVVCLSLGCGKLFGRGHDAGPDVPELSDPFVSVVPDAGTAAASVDASCPRPLHGGPGVGYCRFRCRSWADRQASKHARRVSHPSQVAFGKCGGDDVFAEVDHHDAGVTEFFDPKTGMAVGAIDTIAPGCPEYGDVPKCTPQLTWQPAPPIKGATLGSLEDDDEPNAPPLPAQHH